MVGPVKPYSAGTFSIYGTDPSCPSVTGEQNGLAYGIGTGTGCL